MYTTVLGVSVDAKLVNGYVHALIGLAMLVIAYARKIRTLTLLRAEEARAPLGSQRTI